MIEMTKYDYYFETTMMFYVVGICVFFTIWLITILFPIPKKIKKK